MQHHYSAQSGLAVSTYSAGSYRFPARHTAEPADGPEAIAACLEHLDIVAHSASMRQVLERASAAARSDAPVLIVGETGTGKELIARTIHALAARRHRPFVAINCAALPHDLIESELFGHRRGAFSGAHVDHSGLFASAHQGTLFLDEIGELALQAQAKLLRTLQDGAIRPVGGLEQRVVDVRVIAATNRSTRELRSGTLRADLFFRLSVLVIEIPPLRERSEEIPHLVDRFLARNRAAGMTRLQGIEPEAAGLLMQYRFPGNVRELEGMIQSLCVTLPADETRIKESHLKGWFRGHAIPNPWIAERTADANDPAPTLRLRDLEAWAIRTALERARGNKSRAAQLLGISRDRLYRKLTESPGEVHHRPVGQPRLARASAPQPPRL